MSDLRQEYFGLIVLALFSPLAWIRKIETFKIGFMFGFAMIIVTVITISTFCISMNLGSTSTQDLTLEQRGFNPINYETYFSTIGFFFFLFEGIGGLMPIMSATKDREVFPYLLCGALGFLCIMYIIFGELCYYTFGSGLTKPIIMEMMPADNPIIQVVKILFMINLVFSYPLTIFITNLILEGFTFKRMKQNTPTRKWLKNFQRSLVLGTGIVCAMYLRDSLDRIFALSGTLLGTTVVMAVPAICHYKLLAKTKGEKILDVALVVVAMNVMVFCTYRIIMQD